MGNVHKVVEKRGLQLVETWKPLESGAPDHLWDCECYQIAGAYMARVHMLPSEDELEEHRRALDDERRRRSRAGEQRSGEGAPGWDVQDLSQFL